MTEFESLQTFMTGIRARRRGMKFILDGWNSEFYLIFDATEDPDMPETWGTVDILASPCGEHPDDSDKRIRLKADCTKGQVRAFLIGLGVDRFGELTRIFLTASNNWITTK